MNGCTSPRCRRRARGRRGSSACRRRAISSDSICQAANRNFEAKPYGITKLTTDRLRSPAVLNPTAAAGLDPVQGTARCRRSSPSTRIFAQVEVDEQQVNLARASLHLPEKRDFFLEGRRSTARGPGVSRAAVAAPADRPTPHLVVFYTRRIGLNRGREIPIGIGGRVTGKVGKYSLGVMNIQTGDELVSLTPDTNFTVVRVKRDILRRSSVGAIVTNRSSGVAPGSGSNETGRHLARARFAFSERQSGLRTPTETDGLTSDDDSYEGRFDYLGNRSSRRDSIT